LEAILHVSKIKDAVEPYSGSPGNLGFMVRQNSTSPVHMEDDKQPEISKIGEP